jgi:hypothetical protein
MLTLNKIQIEDIRFRSEHCQATNQDCKDLIEHIDCLTFDLDCEGSLTQRIVDNITQYVDVDFEVTVDKTALKRFLSGEK